MREIIIGHVELTLIFLYDDFFMQNRDFRASKGPFLGQKDKNLRQTTVVNLVTSLGNLIPAYHKRKITLLTLEKSHILSQFVQCTYGI